MRRSVRSLLAVAALVLVPAALRAQQTGTVTGVVTGQGNTPVPNAAIQVVGTTLGGRTNDDGTYRITGVPTGARTLRASRIGYAAQTQPVTVPAGGNVAVNFTLSTAAVVLGDVTVTAASGETMRKRESGASTAVVSFDSAPPPPSANLSESLNGKAAGVTIMQASGTSGAGAKIRIRGSNSMSLSNEPLLIIDGVRSDNTPESNSIDVGGVYPSRINDLNPDDIESVEVIKGPAAAALYGTAAANGVIQITTKKGRAGATRWSTYGERGQLKEITKFPDNYGGWTDTSSSFPGVIGSPTASPFCNLDEQMNQTCHIDSVARLNPLRDFSPFRIGDRSKFGGSVNGGSDRLQYYLSGDKEVEEGVLKNNFFNRFNLRSNVRASLRKDLDVTLNAGYTNSGMQLPQTDNSYYAPLGNGYGGDAYPGLYHGYDPIPPEQSYQVSTTQDVDRFVGSLNANYTPLSWLKFTSVTGADLLSRIDREVEPRGAVYFTDASLLGEATSNQFRVANYTANFSGIATFQLAENLASTTTLGSQYTQSDNTGTYAYGEDLAGGISSLHGVAARFAVDERTISNKTLGGIFSEELAWRDRLFLTAAARADKNSAFGQNLGSVVYPAASLSYVVSEEGFWPTNPVVTSLRLRAAYGESGLRPGPLDALQYSVLRGATVGGKDTPGLALANFANPNLKPERTGETEGGFEAALFGDRASLDVTAYSKLSRDALVLRRLPPSLGGPQSQFENIGRVSNRGLEVALNSAILRMRTVEWDASVNASWNKNRLVSLAPGVPDIVFGASSSQRHTPGRPLGAFYGRVITGYHVTSTGVVDPNTITRSAVPTYLGSSVPTRTATLSTGITFFKVARLSTLLDYKGGHMQYNNSEGFRCGIGTCQGLNDSTDTPYHQARAMARYESSSAIGDFIEHADYVKVREVALTLSAPRDWAALARAEGASLVFSGRNLHTWTKYTGLDPEQNEGQDNFTAVDFLGQPNTRYFTVRLNLNY